MAGLFDGTPLERPVTCPRCEKTLEACGCPSVDPSTQQVRVRREKRRGKWTTIVSGLTLERDELKALGQSLRSELGTGGGITDGRESLELLLQGDHQDATIKSLKSKGYPAKTGGG